MKKTWIGCLALTGLLLLAGCSPKDNSAKLPEPSSTTSVSSEETNAQTEPAQEETTSEMEESEAVSSEEGRAEEPEPSSEPAPALPEAVWKLIPDRGDPTWTPSPHYKLEEISSYVTAQPVQDEYTTDDTTIGICLQNKGEKYFMYDLEYRLEKSTEEGWEALDLKPYAVIEDYPFYVGPGQSKTLYYSLSNLVRPPEPGLYRITLCHGGVNSTFTLRAGDPLKAKVRNAMFYGDEVASLVGGHIAVVPGKRVYPLGVNAIWADYVNTSDELGYFAAEPQCFIMEKAQDDGWVRIPYAEHATFPDTPVIVNPHSETVREFYLSLLDPKWLTAGEYRILVKAPSGSNQEWIVFSFCLAERTAD